MLVTVMMMEDNFDEILVAIWYNYFHFTKLGENTKKKIHVGEHLFMVILFYCVMRLLFFIHHQKKMHLQYI